MVSDDTSQVLVESTGRVEGRDTSATCRVL